MKLARLAVRAKGHRRCCCPVQAEVALDASVDLGRLMLWDEVDGRAAAVQAWPVGDGRVGLGWIVDRMAPGAVRHYELCQVDGPCALGAGVQLEQLPGKLKVRVGGKHFTTYNYEQVVRPYLYPVFAADEVGVTRNWPMVEGLPDESTDHIHHKGIYTAQDDINGVKNWGEGPGHGWQVHKAFSHTYSGPVAGGFTAELDWTDAEHRVYMTETRQLTFYATPQDVRLLDYRVTLHASEEDLTIGDTKEGGLISVRIACAIEEQRGLGGVIVNGCGGVSEAETWGKRAPWCDYSGLLGGKAYGVTVMDHPRNPRYPTPWHVRAYGLMTANCFGRHDFTGDPNNRWDMPIAKGESKTWRYRVLVHHGDAQAARAAVHFEGFAYPPAVEAVR